MTDADSGTNADSMSNVAEGSVLFTLSPEAIEATNLTTYMTWLRRERGLDFANYAELHRWSVTELGAFWESLVAYFDVRFHTPYTQALGQRRMPGAEWFAGGTLNYAEHALRRRDHEPALLALNEAGERSELSYAELYEQVCRAAAGLSRLGVGRGDRVAAFLPNVPEALVLFLATASLGAIWSSCAPEFGAQSVLDRLRQITPKVLCTVDGYRYGGKSFDRRAAVHEIAAGLPSLEHVVSVTGIDARELGLKGELSYAELLAEFRPLQFLPVEFDHPLWVLYSSGTTGLPKPIVHGHGGILLEHLKALSLHSDLRRGDRFFWYSTTGWMMWNYLVGGLLVGSSLVLYDGSPAFPDLSCLWEMAAREGITYFGTSAPYLMACRKAGLRPGAAYDLVKLRGLGSTGAPLPVDGFDWVYQEVSASLLLGSVSGGTDVCTAFVLSCPLLAVRAGEIQCAGLGCAVQAFDDEARPITGEVGELVLSEPMPSMPIYFWGDPDGSRYHDSYFSMYPGIWRHGDFTKVTASGGFVIYGRSDSTLNRGGVRMGTSEFYRLVENLPEVADSLVIDTGSIGQEGKLWLFLVARAGAPLDDVFMAKLRRLLRTELSPRHVPDEIRVVSRVPRTLSGKKLEVPVKRILNGTPVSSAVNKDTLSDPDSLAEYLVLAPHA